MFYRSELYCGRGAEAIILLAGGKAEVLHPLDDTLSGLVFVGKQMERTMNGFPRIGG